MAINYSVNSTPFEGVFIPRLYTNLYRQNYPTAFNTQMWAWGSNVNGQLGQGDTIHRSSPVQIGSLTGWITVASTRHTLAIDNNGYLWAWGANLLGELGDNTIVHKSSPIQIGSLTNWSEVITIESNGSAAVKTDGTLWSWGSNTNGTLGIGTSGIPRSSPVQVGSLTNWAYLAGGGTHLLSVKTDNTLWAWGLNSNGQLGDGTIVHKSSPVQIGLLANWSKISAGGWNSASIKTDGTFWSWGYNINGQLGDGTVVQKSSPVQVGALTNWRTLSAGASGTSAIKTDGTLWSWGPNQDGQLGDGTIIHRSSPVQIGSLTNWKLSSVVSGAGGASSSANFSAIKTDGSLWTWGYNLAGSLGNGDGTLNSKISSPVQVGSLTNWKTMPQRQGYFTLFAFSY